MFGVDPKGKGLEAEENTHPPGVPRRATKLFFGVEVEDPDALPEPEASPRITVERAAEAATSVPEGELPPEELTHPGPPVTFTLQTFLTVVTSFGVLCGLCLAVAVSARQDRFRSLQRAEAAEEKTAVLEKELKQVQARVSALDNEKAANLAAQAEAAGRESALKKAEDAKKAKGAKKHKR